MKKNKLFGLLCLIMVIVLNSSCSNNEKMKALLENIPENTDLVLVGNLKTIVESAGGTMEKSKIKLPSYITSSLSQGESDNLDEMNAFLKKSGINTEACALMLDYKENRPVIVFSLDNKKKFIEAIEEEKFKEKSSEGDVTIYSKKVYEGSDPEYDDYGYVALTGSCAYWIDRVWVGSDFKAIPYLQKTIEKAKEGSFADTPYAEYIIDGNMGGLSVSIPKEFKEAMRNSGISSEMLSLYEGTFCIQGDLSNNQCVVNLKLFDEDGKEVSADKFSKFMDTSATINKKALALLGKDEFMIYAISLKNFNWDNYANMMAEMSGMSRSQKAELNAIMSYFEKIDGTVTLGVGLTNGIESINNIGRGINPLDQFSSTVVIETKDGKAKQFVEDIKGFLEKSQIPFVDNSSGLSVNLEPFGLQGNIYVKNVDNFIALANHTIKEDNNNEVVNSTSFDEYLFAILIGLNKKNELIRDMNISNNVKLGLYCKPNTTEASLVLDIDGEGDTGIIAKAAKIVINLVEQSNVLERRLKNMNGDEQAIDVDTVAIDEECYDVEIVDSVAY